MDAHERRHAKDYGWLAMCVASVIFAVSFLVLVCWLVLAEQRTKLYEADNVVCASQPFSMTCYERKAR
jgi:threonine/homoserine/homoserine lactone efflux protein